MLEVDVIRVLAVVAEVAIVAVAAFNVLTTGIRPDELAHVATDDKAVTHDAPEPTALVNIDCLMRI